MEQKGWCRVVEIRNYDENTQIEPIENDRVYIHRQSLKLLDEYIEIGSVYEFRRLKKESDEYFLKWLEYKKLEEQGLLLRLPCRVGDTVYTTRWWDCERESVKVDGKTYFREVRKPKISKENFSLFDYKDFGKSVFLTKKEAEQALAEMEK